MAQLEQMQHQQRFNGLVILAVLMLVVLCSPLLYFAVNLALGNADMFSINGAK